MDVEPMEVEQTITRDSVLSLIQQKEKIESEIRQLQTVLNSYNIGMTEPLVDIEGYPRTDIDVFQVRYVRNKIICLNNDHKGLMKIIEEGLLALHGEQSKAAWPMTSASVSTGQQHTEPVVKVNFVAPISPAAEAGICVEDLIVKFGSVNASNFKSVQDIAYVVQHSQDKYIPVLVKRQEEFKRLNLKPHLWSGQGLLGCTIVPIEKNK